MADGASNDARRAKGPRLIALVGPFQSGKTSLLEAILARTGAISRQGAVRDGSCVGDASAEARAHAMSVEANVASTDYLGDTYTFIDCPGSVEFSTDMKNVLPVCDAAVVVCEADPRKLPALHLILRELEEQAIPRLLFLNKIDIATARVRETLAMLQPASRTPLLLRQIPIWNDGAAVGSIDLALERAYVYRDHAASTVVDIPADELAREKEARFSMLERLADYDDALMEELVGEIEPPRDQVIDDLARDLRAGHAVPLLLGAAEKGNGVTRLLKALRHEVPGIETVRDRLDVSSSGPPLAHIVRTVHTAHGGKLSLARVLRGSFAEGVTAISSRGHADRIGGVSRLLGATATKQPKAEMGETVAFGRLEHMATGDSFADIRGQERVEPAVPAAPMPAPVHAFALAVTDKKDEVRLAAALAKLCEEDPSLVFVQDQESGEMKLLGQGEMHLRVALERLAARFGVTVAARKPAVAYRETIREPVSVRGRHKKQSGGHGQFGDVVIDVKPLPRGEGFVFEETVHGGTVPRQYFGSVEAGCRDSLTRGPLGFRVVDLAVTLKDGSYHAVDSSDMAFRQAARVGMGEALPKARPVLLEPILSVDITVPSEALSRVSSIVSARRGQMLGYDGRPDWDGWDVLRTLIPEAEMENLIVDLRSATAGVGTYVAHFDHLSELTGKAADAVVAQASQHRAGAAAH